MTVPCECGCGAPAPLAKRTDSRDGYFKGQPLRFIRGHQNAANSRAYHGTPEAEHVETPGPLDTPCWVWQRCLNSKGYGVRGRGGQRVLAHRDAYERAHGLIPDGLTIDHLCCEKRCVNPAHLEAVTDTENKRRAARLSVAQVRFILSCGWPAALVAAEFGISKSYVYQIRSGQRWAGVEAS